MTTLLERMAQALEPGAFDEAEFMARADIHTSVGDFERGQERAKERARAALRAVLTPTVAMVNRGGGKAFAGPQPEGGPPMIYPAAIWREMVSFIIEERDRERPDEEPAPDADAADAQEMP